MAGAAGQFFRDPPPLGEPGPATRAAVIAGLVGLDFPQQYLFEGGLSGYLLDEEGVRDLTSIAGTPTFGGDQLSRTSIDSINCGNTVQCLFEYNFTVPLTTFAWELWYRQPDLGHNRCVLTGSPLNSNINMGRANNTFRYPMFRNDTNGAVGWESEVDLYGDNKIHCLLEAHELATRENYILYIDGMPVASGTNAGALNNGFFGGHGGWSSSIKGPSFNGRNVGLTDAERSGADFGSFHFYNDGAELTQLAVRQLFEGTALPGQDMLQSPRWFILDSINCTVSAAPAKDLTCGDVTDNTGGRSGAIPRSGKVYFEVEIIAQGDDTASNLLGLRRLSEGGNVGFIPTLPTFEYHTDGAGDVVDGAGTTLGITGTLGTAATGRIFQFAIDWDSGDWWMGTDDTVYAGVGGVGNPSTGANPLDAIDERFNWAVVNRVNGANGNGIVRLITANNDLNHIPPLGFNVWEDANDSLFENVVLLVRSNLATNGQITFTDESPVAQTLTRIGDVVYDNTESIFGDAVSMLFDGSGNDSVDIPDTPNLDFSDRTVEFCIEAWIFITDNTSLNTIINGRDNANAEEWVFRTGGAGVNPAPLVFAVFGGGSTIISVPSADLLLINTWYHVAVTREEVSGDGLITVYIDGVSVATGTQTADGTTNTNPYQIGHNDFNTTRDFTGHIDSVRVTRGNIRYPGAFTRPNGAFPAKN